MHSWRLGDCAKSMLHHHVTFLLFVYVLVDHVLQSHFSL